MNAQQQIAQIQNEASARIAAIQAAESALAAAVAANATSEQERAEQEQRAAAISAAVDQWHAERLPALMGEFDAIGDMVTLLRADHAQAVALLRDLPSRHNRLARQIEDAIAGAVAERLALPDVTDRNRAGVENEIRGILIDGRDLRVIVDSALKDLWAARGWAISRIAFD